MHMASPLHLPLSGILPPYPTAVVARAVLKAEDIPEGGGGRSPAASWHPTPSLFFPGHRTPFSGFCLTSCKGLSSFPHTLPGRVQLDNQRTAARLSVIHLGSPPCHSPPQVVKPLLVDPTLTPPWQWPTHLACSPFLTVKWP